MRVISLLISLCLLAALAGCAPAPNSAGAGSNDLTVYLVRHAEKTKETPDPGLTEAGQVRALLLADRLETAGIEVIHSSDYIRTRDTAAPLAERLGLEVQLYDPSDLPGMATKLKAAGGTHLVVGHSNTTPQLTELLGGDGGEPIVEATEYDRLYVVQVSEDGAVRSELDRFGESGG